MDYWTECVEEALHDAGVVATPEQIEMIAGAVEGGHENYGMAHGHDAIPNPRADECDRLRNELEKERRKIKCDACGGNGNYDGKTPSPHIKWPELCWKCDGEGRLDPHA